MEYPLTELMEFDEILMEYLDLNKQRPYLEHDQLERWTDLVNEMRVRIPRRGMQ